MTDRARRNFLKLAAAMGGMVYSADLLAVTLRQANPHQEPGDAILPTTVLGRTGRTVCRLGLGAFPISRIKEEDEAIAVVKRSLELGVRYIDTAPSYGAGRSERRVGAAVRASGIPRDEFFVATKTLRRDAGGARSELEESLERLGLDFVDCVQVHEVHDDVERLFGEDAVLAELEKARGEGLISHIGITGHRNPSYLMQAIERFDFVTALVPVNPLDTKHLSFIGDFLPVARERKVAVIAMKVFAGGSLLSDGRFTAGELLRYALSQDEVSVVVPGCETIEHVDEAVAACRGFDAMAEADRAALEERAGEHRGRASEWYKDE